MGSFVQLFPAGLLLFLLALPACEKPDLGVDYFSWTNPVTGAVVQLPEGWRQSPETARKGETTVGYFTPLFSAMLGRYGHVTLHYEDMREAAEPMTLERFVEHFVRYMRPRAERISEPVFEQAEGMRTARLSLEVSYRDRSLLLKVRFWTPNELDFWYAVVEALAEDGQFAQKALPLIEKLRASCRIGRGEGGPRDGSTKEPSSISG